MDLPLAQILLLVALTALNAVLAGSEIAFVSLREGQLQRLAEAPGGALVVRLAREPNRFLATIQVGITLSSFFASATAAVSLAEPLEAALPFGDASRPVSVALVTLVLAYFTLVFGELAPKRIAMQRSEGWAMLMARPLLLLSQFTRPAVWVLARSTDLAVRLFGGDPSQQREEVTEEELRDMIDAQPTFSDAHRSIIEGAFEVADRTLREIVVPRNSVTAIDHNTSVADAMRTLADNGRSRAPVHTGDLDDVLGIVHLRDLIGAEGTVATPTRPATVLPESLGVLDALHRLQSGRQQMAIVVNEHGGVEGIVTVEDLLEEIVGEIYDEFDRDVSQVVHDEDGSITLPGAFPVHDLNDLEVDLPDGDGTYATVAGYVLARLGHIPEPGEIVEGPAWNVEVLEVTERAITKVRLSRAPQTLVDAEHVPSL